MEKANKTKEDSYKDVSYYGSIDVIHTGYEDPK
jgi:hypothetical protein